MFLEYKLQTWLNVHQIIASFGVPAALTSLHPIIFFFQDGSKEDSQKHLAELLYVNLENKIARLKDNIMLDDRSNLTIGRRYLEAKRVGYRYIIVINDKSFEDDPLYEFNDINANSKVYFTENEIIDYINKNYRHFM